MKKRSHVVYLTNIPAPYRERMHEMLANNPDFDYSVIYCSATEPNRQWTFDKGRYKTIYLSGKSNTLVHNNINVVKHLQECNPDVVISTGFNPTMLYGFFWCLLNGRKFIPFTDGTLQSEMSLTRVHKWVRKMVFSRAPSFIGASLGSIDLYKSYHVKEDKIFRSCLCIENDQFVVKVQEDKKYDLMFSGQLIDRKMPFFFVEVARQMKARIPALRLLILGDGPLRKEMLEKLDEYQICYDYPGFVQPKDLPQFYLQSKVFMFPTKNDPWGVVANEACAAGMPVITCGNAGVANDLIIHDHNGYVLPLQETVWADHACELLTNETLYQRLSANSMQAVNPFNSTAATKGIIDAVNFSTNN